MAGRAKQTEILDAEEAQLGGVICQKHVDALRTGWEGEQVQAPSSNSFVSLHCERGALTAAVSWTGQINSAAIY